MTPAAPGRSTRAGPFDLDTDVADLGSIIEAAGAGGAVAVGPANGAAVATLCASRRPDLVKAVIAPTGVPIAAPRLEQAHGRVTGGARRNRNPARGRLPDAGAHR